MTGRARQTTGRAAQTTGRADRSVPRAREATTGHDSASVRLESSKLPQRPDASDRV
jgi:hypothetical protein